MRILQRGMYCPVPCFFLENEDVDYDTFTRHVVRVSTAGCLPLISGTLGEATHLSPEERMELIRRAREGLDQAGLNHVAIVAGTGAPSTRESISLCIDAHKAGADAALVVPSGYYGGILKANMSLLEQHFVDIAEASPIPVMIYDSVYVTGGIDLDSRLIENLAKRSSNSCGVKLTCPSLGKMTRLTAVIHSKPFMQQYPRKQAQAPFLLLTGLIDNVLAAATVGADGSIGGPTNFAPYAAARLWELSQKPLCGENLREAVELQAAIARADGAAFDAGVPAMKWLLGEQYGAGKAPRRPLPCMSEEKGRQFKADLKEILEIEARLEQAACGIFFDTSCSFGLAEASPHGRLKGFEDDGGPSSSSAIHPALYNFLFMPQEVVKITAGPYTFLARFEETAAPKTVAVFKEWFRKTYEEKIIHVRWSGEACWIPLGDKDLNLAWENHTSHPAPGQIIVYPGGISETEVLLAYGACSFSSIVGQVAGNHFLTIYEGLENLRALGKLVLWEGAQSIKFELIPQPARSKHVASKL